MGEESQRALTTRAKTSTSSWLASSSPAVSLARVRRTRGGGDQATRGGGEALLRTGRGFGDEGCGTMTNGQRRKHRENNASTAKTKLPLRGG